MGLISAHDLKTGAAFVLPGNARCVEATRAHHPHEVDHTIDHAHLDPAAVRPLSSCRPGSIVYVEWKGPRSKRWLKLRLIRTE